MMKQYLFLDVLLVFASSISQVLLKKSANENKKSIVDEYINYKVILAYGIFFLTTIGTILIYKVLPISVGAILESLGYVFICFWSIIFFNEKISKKKIISILLIILGTVIYSINI